MNYCILNGVKSTTITGLLIQELPMISKPLIRTEIEEIDGRDGDIVTKLGYSAYDKEMVIGLHGNYDIDDVIAFFDSEGTVTFSNEPDKYYNYQILEAIDFERLIRWKQATVKFHVQPFKYSAVDQSFLFSNQSVNLSNGTQTKNGITVSVSNGTITVTGTATAATDFYLPIDEVSLTSGNYTLTADADGSGQETCSIRLVNDAPSDSFGDTYATLSDEAVTFDAELTQAESYNYLYLFFAYTPTKSVALNFTATVTVESDNRSITIRNIGNTTSKPTMTITGSGTINLYLNGSQIFVINLSTTNSVTIDVAAMNAYQDDNLMNRYVTGDYDNMVLNVGSNTISWTGDLWSITFEDFSRWL